jgi:hypothetical protein
MTPTQTATVTTSTTSTESFTYEVPIDPMDELHCESCQ